LGNCAESRACTAQVIEWFFFGDPGAGARRATDITFVTISP
jgi:hypothetical protein